MEWEFEKIKKMEKAKRDLTKEERRIQLLAHLSADFILEQTALFKESIFDDFKLDPDTVDEIKKRFRIWHRTWVEKGLIEFLGEDCVSKKEVQDISLWLLGESGEFEKPENAPPFWWRSELRKKLEKLNIL